MTIQESKIRSSVPCVFSHLTNSKIRSRIYHRSHKTKQPGNLSDTVCDYSSNVLYNNDYSSIYSECWIGCLYSWITTNWEIEAIVLENTPLKTPSDRPGRVGVSLFQVCIIDTIGSSVHSFEHPNSTVASRPGLTVSNEQRKSTQKVASWNWPVQ